MGGKNTDKKVFKKGKFINTSRIGFRTSELRSQNPRHYRLRYQNPIHIITQINKKTELHTYTKSITELAFCAIKCLKYYLLKSVRSMLLYYTCAVNALIWYNTSCYREREIRHAANRVPTVTPYLEHDTGYIYNSVHMGNNTCVGGHT